MIEGIYKDYRATFQASPIMVKAPGRINLIGEHTDYNKGFVLPAAMDKAIYFALRHQPGQHEIHIQSSNYKDRLILDPSAERQSHIPAWGRYFRAILDIFREGGMDIHGINCIFEGNIPIGAGLSSSAALCCGFICGLSEVLEFSISKKEIALIAQKAEHRIGLNCGLMDQYAVLFGKEGQAFCLDCRNLEFHYFPIELQRHSLVLINSKIEHHLAVDSAYNNRREACENVVRRIAEDRPNVRSLRDITMPELESYQSRLDPIHFKRAQYVLEENQRVLDTVRALEQKDLPRVGQLLYQSHYGLSSKYEVSTPEMDQLVALTLHEPGVLGARMMGGGFGGCTINLIQKAHREAIVERIVEGYRQVAGHDAEVYDVAIGNGVELSNLETIKIP